MYHTMSEHQKPASFVMDLRSGSWMIMELVGKDSCFMTYCRVSDGRFRSSNTRRFTRTNPNHVTYLGVFRIHWILYSVGSDALFVLVPGLTGANLLVRTKISYTILEIKRRKLKRKEKLDESRKWLLDVVHGLVFLASPHTHMVSGVVLVGGWRPPFLIYVFIQCLLEKLMRWV